MAQIESELDLVGELVVWLSERRERNAKGKKAKESDESDQFAFPND